MHYSCFAKAVKNTRAPPQRNFSPEKNFDVQLELRVFNFKFSGLKKSESRTHCWVLLTKSKSINQLVFFHDINIWQRSTKKITRIDELTTAYLR